MLTLALGDETNADRWKLARSVGAPIVSHIVSNMGNFEPLAKAGLMGPDNEYIHCTRAGNETHVEDNRGYRRQSLDRPGHRDANAARNASAFRRRSITESGRA